MSKKDIICGVDVGSSQTRSVIAELVSHEEKPRIIGVGTSPSGGVRKGVIVDLEETVKSINDSLEQAERTAGVNVKEILAKPP